MMMKICCSSSSSLQRLRTERDSLKEALEELHCVQAQEGQLTSGTHQEPCFHALTSPCPDGALLLFQVCLPGPAAERLIRWLLRSAHLR